MSFSDSMFLLELNVDELKSFIDCEAFIIKSQFANVFLLKLKDPNDLEPLISNAKMKILKKKTKVIKTMAEKPMMEDMVQVGQSILFTSHIDTLITTMKIYPIELWLYNKNCPDKILGSAQIPWSPVYIDYLRSLKIKLNVSSAHITGAYNIYDDNSRRMATIKLNIKLTHLKDKVTSFRSLPEVNPMRKAMWENLKPTTVLSTIKEAPRSLMKRRDIIQGSMNDKKQKGKTETIQSKRNDSNTNRKEIKTSLQSLNKENIVKKAKLMTCNSNYIKSDTDLPNHKRIDIVKAKSSSSLNRKHLNILNYIFGDVKRPFGEQVLCVGYFTVENDTNKERSPSKNSSIKEYSSEKSNSKGKDMDETMSTLDAADLIYFRQCANPTCHGIQNVRQATPKPDDRIQLALPNLQNEHNNITEKVEVAGEISAKFKMDRDDCFCSCECTFGFVKHTTYCGICGGYERPGEDMPRKIIDAPFPCPIYHKLVDKNKQKTLSTSGSDKSKNKGEDSLKSLKKGKTSISGTRSESEKGKGKLKKKNDIFKYNYGYKAPQLGHSRCVMPCTGTLGAVPKNMGWLWTADTVPGMKFRSMWRPGATNKHVVHALKLAKYPDQIIKKKKRDTGKKKKPLKRPLLTVAKKDGEYTITMETMKTFSKPRAVTQYPYEDTPLVTFTVGRTEEENRERQKKKERAKRRLERDQRAFIQSTFRNVCKEICLKTYQQALGILPDGEDPDCPCYPKEPGPDDTNLDLSCSCSEASTSFASDTDSDEWIVEFTPPNATFNPVFTGKKLTKVDGSSQYTYLDYKVRILDKSGNVIPRYFEGPDGKTQCSDLGGFWSPDRKWLEINVDGYISPDGKWAPMIFTGPNGEQVDCDTGKFQVGNTGVWLVVGVDGYIDVTGKWKFYPKTKNIFLNKVNSETGKSRGDKNEAKSTIPSEVTWSCFGAANAKELSKMGIYGHGQDRKLLLQALNHLIAKGENVTIPQPTIVSRPQSVKKTQRLKTSSRRCKHAKPSNKGIVAVDGYGNKIYFKLKDSKNKRPRERINQLKDRGISLSSFHAPCFHSFINQQMVKKQLYDRRMKLANLGEHICQHEKAPEPDYMYIV